MPNSFQSNCFASMVVYRGSFGFFHLVHDAPTHRLLLFYQIRGHYLLKLMTFSARMTFILFWVETSVVRILMEEEEETSLFCGLTKREVEEEEETSLF